MDYKLRDFELSIDVTRIANVHYFEFTKEYHTYDDSHDFCELLYVDSGSIEVESENYSGTLTSNQLIIHTPNENHSLKCNDTECPNVIIIGFACNNKELCKFSNSPFTLQQRHKKMLSEIMKEGMNVFAPPYDIPYTAEMTKRENSPYASEQMLKINLEAFLITIIRDYDGNSVKTIGSSAVDSKIADIYNYINIHYSERITLEDICFLFGMNKTSLCRKFKEEYGITVLNYIIKLKIDEAKVYIREQQFSITEISEKLGFSSIHYFCRLFKKQTGFSPKEYSKTIRSKLNL